jgi:hypothetical protein
VSFELDDLLWWLGVQHWRCVAMTMLTEIQQFSEVEVSDDGNSIMVTAELSDGAVMKWAVPYRHAIWLARAIFVVAHKAVERQVAGGAIEPSTIAMDALRVESLEVLVKPKEERAAVAAIGTWTSNGAPGTTALLVDSSTAQVLMDQLRQFVQATPTLYRPT